MSEQNGVAERGDLEQRAASLELRLAEATGRIATLERRNIELTVDNMIGVRLLPAERDYAIEFASKDADMFQRWIETKPALNLMKQLVPTQLGALPSADPSEELAQLALKGAAPARGDE